MVVSHDVTSATGDQAAQIQSIRKQFCVAFSPGRITESTIGPTCIIVSPPPETP
jgi:hypothetical protein